MASRPGVEASDVIVVVMKVAALALGFVTIHWLMRWVQSGRIAWFAPYCLVVGGAAVVFWGLLG